VIQERLGRAAVKYGGRYLRARYRQEIRIGAGVVALLAAIVVLRAVRNVPEG
jgi:hypothetical protein